MKNTIYIVNTSHEPHFNKSIQSAAKKNSLRTRLLVASKLSYRYTCKNGAIDIFYDGKKLPLTNTDYVIIRRWGSNTSSTTLFCIALSTLGIPYMDSKINTQREVRSSKIGQTFLAPRFDVRFPSSWVFTRENVKTSTELIEKYFTYPLVLKTQGSGRGKHVWKCNSRTDFKKKLNDAIKKYGRDLYLIQEFIPNESDIRVVLFKNKIITAIERISNNGFYNNISQGGTGKIIKLSAEEKKIAKSAAKMAGLDLAGVDIVRTKYGPLLFEINKAPDVKCFDEAAGFNLAEKIGQEICSLL